MNSKNEKKPKKKPSSTNCVLTALLQRKANLKRAKDGPQQQQIEANAQSQNYAVPPTAAMANLKMPSQRRAANDYIQLEMPRPIKNGSSLDAINLRTTNGCRGEEDGYTEIDNFSVDVLRLKNRELLQNYNHFYRVSAEAEDGQKRFSDQMQLARPLETRNNLATFGSSLNISKDPKNLSNAPFQTRSTLNLSLGGGTSSFRQGPKATSNCRYGSRTTEPPFPINNGPGSPVKSCKKIIAQQRRALSPNPNARAKPPLPVPLFPTTIRAPTRAISCQSLNYSGQNGMPQNLQLRRGSHATNIHRIPSFARQNMLPPFPTVRIEPAPELPEREGPYEQRGKIVGKNAIEKDEAYAEEEEDGWQKAKLNLQKLIKNLEEDTNGYMELNVKNRPERNGIEMENPYNELSFNSIKNSVKSLSNVANMTINNKLNAKITAPLKCQGNSQQAKEFDLSNFLAQFLSTEVRQLAVWMSEEDCRAFDWPPQEKQQQKQQYFFWSLSDEGEQIRNKIKKRSKLIENLIEKTLEKNEIKIFEKWICLATELLDSFDNNFAFGNIMNVLTRKMTHFPAFFHKVENQKVSNEFRTKLIPAYNALKGKITIVNMNGQAVMLLPHFDEFAKLFNQNANNGICQKEMQAKIDLLWTFTKLARQMLSGLNEVGTKIGDEKKNSSQTNANPFSNDNL